MELTQERVRELFDYFNGALYSRKDCGVREAGKKIGSISNGYLMAKVDGKQYSVHRLIWLYHHGYFPENEIDHINRDRGDNRILNLREVSRSCNIRNTGNFGHNTSGVKGVSLDKRVRKWIAQIRYNGRNIFLGTYIDFSEAVCHRLAAEQALGWYGCDSSSPAFKYVSKFQGKK